mmetsp:Transcript_32922/g.66845  ORF Transcript_32922/g.66845 Transcript_32922/m.66845 type:complete len:190 (-) Transcript_32922:248-817(-)
MGKRKMESAIEQTAGMYDVSVQWRPFLLRPNHPREGVPKPPDTPDNPRVGARMKQMGMDVGIDFTGKCDRAPNTLWGHCLLQHVLETKGAGAQNELQEAIFRGYFTDGLYPDVDNLAALAARVGLDADEARAVLQSGQYEEAVTKEATGYSRGGVSGVPYFIVNGKPVFSGAQDSSAFVSAFQQLATDP